MPAPVRTPPPTAPAQSFLARIKPSKRHAPDRNGLHALDAVGKTTLLSELPGVLLLDLEDGAHNVNVPCLRRDSLQTPRDLLALFRELASGKGHVTNLAIDSADDGLQAMIESDVKARNNVDTIEAVGGGYGKGHTAVGEALRALLVGLEQMQNSTGIGVWITCHTRQESYTNPMGLDWQRFVLNLSKQCSPILRGWLDCLLFMRLEEEGRKLKDGKVKGFGTDTRLIHTERTATYDAKNRYNLPSLLEYERGNWWATWSAARASGDNTPFEAVLAIFEEWKATNPTPERLAEVNAAVDKAKDREAIRPKLVSRLRELIAEPTAVNTAEKE